MRVKLGYLYPNYVYLNDFMERKKHIVILSSLFSLICIVSLFSVLPLSDKSTTNRGSEWMKKLDDDVSISSLSIPGSHDSGSLHSIGDLSGKCQDLSIASQLKAGVRFFDIRLQQRNDEMKVVHGIVDQKLDFSNVLDVFKSFLKEYPSEGIIASIKKEGDDVNCTSSFETTLKKELNDYSSILNLDREAPDSLGSLRGKVYLVSRYKDNTIGLPAYEGWIEHDKNSTTNTFDIKESNLHVQDYFKIYDIENKKKEITACLEYSKTHTNILTLNFTSCYYLDSFPPTYAGTTAKIINRWISEVIENENNLGILVSDFVTSDLCEAIYKRNLK